MFIFTIFINGNIKKMRPKNECSPILVVLSTSLIISFNNLPKNYLTFRTLHEKIQMRALHFFD